MNKYVKNGKVAVLYSPGFSCGWSTECEGSMKEELDMIFNPDLAKMVDESSGLDWNKIQDMALELFPNAHFDGLAVRWVEQGSKFIIHNDEGMEEVMELGDQKWITA